MKGERHFGIVYVTVGVPGESGVEEFLLPEINALIERGYDVTVVPREYRRGSSRSVQSELGARVKSVGLASPQVILAFTQALLRDFRLVRDIFRDVCRDTTLRNKLKNVRVLPKGVWLGKFASTQSIKHIHAHWGATTATMAEVAHRVSGIPYSLTLHRGDIVQNNRLEKKADSASFVRFISLSGVELYKRVTGKDPMLRANVSVIHMGVRLPAEGSVAPPAASSPFRIVCPASFIPLKGHQFLLEAVHLLKERKVDVCLSLAGEGMLRVKLEECVRNRGLQDRIEFLGKQKHEILLGAYRKGAFDSVVLPSIDLGNGEHEGIPVSLMEGMAVGLPVVSTETGGIPELLHGGAGLLVTERDAVGLADAIQSLATNHAFACDTGERGRARVLSEFNIIETSRTLSRLFDASS